MVDEVGVAPTVFLMSQIYSLLPSLLGLLIHVVGLERIALPIVGSKPTAFTTWLQSNLKENKHV